MLATSVQVLAAGLSGQEDLALDIDGVEVRRWADVGGNFAARQFVTFDYTHPTDVTAGRIAVRMVNSAGANRDLRVDGIRVNGVKFESESPTTWNTGAYSNTLQATVPAYAQSEVIYPDGGGLFFSDGASTVVAVRAAGRTGTEQMRLLIDDAVVATWSNVGGNYDTGSFQTFTYTHPTKLTPERLKVEFTNDGVTPTGGDRNLRVDSLRIDQRTYQTEAATTFSTGTWANGVVRPGFFSSEVLHANGYLQYTATPAGGSRVVVWAAGATGEESMQVRGDGGVIASVGRVGGNYGARQFVPYAAVHPRVVSLDEVEVAFVNDGTTAGGADRNLRVDAIELDGVRHETESLTTFSTGTWRQLFGVNPGFVQDERLQANGAFFFGQNTADAGVLSLAAAQYSVAENADFVDVEVVRTATRGGVSIDYTTVNGPAVAGQDYAARSGTLVLRDGQARAAVRIPITNDLLREGAETFNVAADRVTGGAFLGAPRTTTVTILDDDAPNVGTGVGLLGEYFSGTEFNTPLFRRTDATVGFDWGTGGPGGSAPADAFSVRWTGQVEPLYTENYTFEVRADDGVRLWVNGVPLVNQWRDQGASTYTGSISLTAGVKYDIRMEYYERSGLALAELRWSSPSQARELVPTTQLYSVPVVSDAGDFAPQTIVSGLATPTAIDFANVGGSSYMYIAQKNGVVRLAINGALQAGAVVDYSTPVNDVRDRGLLGIAVHPDFAQNPYLYLLYTYDPPETQGQSGLAAPDNFGNRGSRLTRLTLDASTGYRTVVAGSDVVLLGKNSTWQYIRADQDSTDNIGLAPSGLLPNGEWVPDILITDSQSHTIGGLDFGPDGALYVSNGDGTSYGRVDPRTTRVQDLDSLSGKVLRIDPLTGAGFADNPFFTGDVNDDRSKVFNYGLRNPFRIAVHPTTGVPYVGDVGWNTWEEINGGRGQNYGWPFYEGGAGNGSLGGGGVNRQTGGYRDLPEAASFYASNNAQPPLWSRSHAAGGVAVVLGDFYTGSVYPAQYQNALFFTDYGDPTIRALTLDAQGRLADQLLVLGSIGTVLEMSMGPDGRMYYVNASGSVGRIDYVGIATGATPAAAQSRTLVRPADRSATFGEESAPTPALSLAPASPVRRGATQARTAFRATTPAANDAALALLLVEQRVPKAEREPASAPRGTAVGAGDREALWRALGDEL